MKKRLTLTLAAVLLLAALTSCRVQVHDPFQDAIEENPDLGDLPQSDVMKPDPDDIPQYEIEDKIDGYESVESFEIPATDEHEAGELVVKYKICTYGDNNLALVSVENHSEQALTVSIDGLCEDTLENKSKTIEREFEGFAANWQNYFVFYPTMPFDEFSYEIDFETYDGETYGQYVTNLEWDGIRISRNPAVPGEPVTQLSAYWFFDYANNKDNWYSCDYILFDAEGGVLDLGMSSLEDVTFFATQGRDSMGPIPTEWWGGRNPIHYGFYVDHNTLWSEVTLDPMGENYLYAEHPVEETDYVLPDKYQNAYGIVAWRDMLGPHRPTVTLPEGYGKN